jgi:Calponin homology (CH) domain
MSVSVHQGVRQSQMFAWKQWINNQLKEAGVDKEVAELQKDLKSGVVLVQVAKHITGKEIDGVSMNPRGIFQELSNLNALIAFLTEIGIRTTNIGAEGMSPKCFVEKRKKRRNDKKNRRPWLWVARPLDEKYTP